MTFGNHARSIYEIADRLEAEHGAEFEQFRRDYAEFLTRTGISSTKTSDLQWIQLVT